jgi:hypothetical protein
MPEHMETVSAAAPDMAAEIERLRASNAELAAALKPFARWIDKVDTAAPSESSTDNNRTCLINGSAIVTYGDFRRARAAVAKAEGGDE